jgi:divalent metal cation (Fe/Co/Zn/Cd) transporter
MRIGPTFDLREAQPELVKKVVRLEWWSIGWLSSVVVVMALAMGSSGAMKTAFVEDLLSLVPPIIILASLKYRERGSSEAYPYGRRRVPDLAFMAAALALLAMGIYLLVEATLTLAHVEKPRIGATTLFGRELWAGWLMLAALVYSVVPPVVLGRLKRGPAEELHERALYADAELLRDDWQTGLAGMVGVIGVGVGYWWADAVAAGAIALSVVWDGVRHTRRVLQHLMEHTPTLVPDRNRDPLVDVLREAMQALDWVSDADVRLQEEGEVLSGEIYLVPKSDTDLVARCEEAREHAHRLHWRFHDLVVVPVREIDRRAPG